MLVIRNLWEKIRKNTLKKRRKAETISVTNPDDSNFRASNYIKNIDKCMLFLSSNRIAKVLNIGNTNRGWKANIIINVIEI